MLPLKTPTIPRKFPQTSPEVFRRLPRSSLPVELTSIQGFPGSFPDFPGTSPGFPGSFPNFPGSQPLSLGSLTPSLDSQNLSLTNSHDLLNKFSSWGPIAKSTSRGRELNTNSFFSSFSGANIPPKNLVFLGFGGHTELFGPHPFTWKTPTLPEDIRTKKFGFGFLFLP